MKEIANKIVVVTGGSGLLGKSIIDKAKEANATVINIDVFFEDDKSDLSIKCDITDESEILDAFNMINLKYGKIDALINNAYPRTKDWGTKFENITIDSWRKNIDYQLNSTFMCCQMALKIMSNQGFGSIINIGSIYGTVGPNFSLYQNTEMTMPAAYSAIKGGIISFTRYLASYYGKFNIRVNCVSPGGIFDKHSSEFVNNYSSKTPLGRMANPNDISPIIIFLISDGASYITGQNILVDGGWTSI